MTSILTITLDVVAAALALAQVGGLPVVLHVPALVSQLSPDAQLPASTSMETVCSAEPVQVAEAGGQASAARSVAQRTSSAAGGRMINLPATSSDAEPARGRPTSLFSCPPKRGGASARRLPHAPSARVFSSRHAACAAPSAALPGGAAVRFRRGGGLASLAVFTTGFSGLESCACGGMTSNTDYRMALRCLSSRTRMLSRLVPCGKEDFTFTIRSIEFLIGAIGSQELSRFQTNWQMPFSAPSRIHGTK